MRKMKLPDTQELIWFAVGIWVAFFVLRMIRAREDGISSVLMYFAIAVAPPIVIIFQDQLLYWLYQLRGMTSKGG